MHCIGIYNIPDKWELQWTFDNNKISKLWLTQDWCLLPCVPNVWDSVFGTVHSLKAIVFFHLEGCGTENLHTGLSDP